MGISVSPIADRSLRTMSPKCRLAPVVQSDISTLGSIFALAFSKDLLRLFIFTHGPDLELSRHNSIVRYQGDFMKSNTRFMKAIDVSTGEIVGFITWTMIDNQGDEVMRDFAPPLNREFNEAVFGGLQRRRIETMRGEKYIRNLVEL